MRYWHGEDRDLRMLLRLSVLSGEHANYSQIITYWILTFHSIYDYFALLKAFNTNTLNYLSSISQRQIIFSSTISYAQHHRTNDNFDTPLFIHSTTQKCYLYQVIPIWNSLPNSLKNFTSKFTFKKQIKSHLLAFQSLHFLII